MASPLSKLFPQWRRWIGELWEELHIVALGLAVMAVGFAIYAYVVDGLMFAAMVLAVFLFTALVISIMFFTITVIFEGSPLWPRTSSIVRRVVGATLFTTVAVLGAKSALVQWSYNRPKAVAAWVLVALLAVLAILMALDRVPSGSLLTWRKRDRDA